MGWLTPVTEFGRIVVTGMFLVFLLGFWITFLVAVLRLKREVDDWFIRKLGER